MHLGRLTGRPICLNPTERLVWEPTVNANSLRRCPAAAVSSYLVFVPVFETGQ